MGSSRITHVHIYIIGGVLMLLLGAGLYFALLKPLNEEIVQLRSDIQGIEQQAVSVDGQNVTIVTSPWPGPKERAQEILDKARERQAAKKAQLASLERRKQLPGDQTLDLGNGDQNHLLRTTMPRWLQMPRYVVTMMGQYARTSARRHGVRVTTAFRAPAPSTDPSAIPRDIVAWNLGQMTVTGEFNRVMRWAEDWNRAPLLVAVDGLKVSLENDEGHVTGTCTLTVYVFPTGQAVASPGAAGGGAGGVGAAGGAMGMPGGAFGAGAPPADMGASGNGPGG
jgi:hypothetical protein